MQNNGQRLRIHSMANVECDCIEVVVTHTHGCENARIFEVRVYEDN